MIKKPHSNLGWDTPEHNPNNNSMIDPLVNHIPRLNKFDDSAFDIINKPKHYTQGNIEVLDFILDQKMNFLEANIIKYTARYKYKNGLEDLRKAQFYLNRLIEETEKNQ